MPLSAAQNAFFLIVSPWLIIDSLLDGHSTITKQSLCLWFEHYINWFHIASEYEERHTDVVVVTILLASILIIVGLVSGFLLYRKKKQNEEDRARFLEMFQIEDLDDELGISRITT